MLTGVCVYVCVCVYVGGERVVCLGMLEGGISGMKKMMKKKKKSALVKKNKKSALGL